RLSKNVSRLPIKLVTASPYQHFLGAVRPVCRRLKRHHQRMYARPYRDRLGITLRSHRNLDWIRLSGNRDVSAWVCDRDLLKRSALEILCEVQTYRTQVIYCFPGASIVDLDRNARAGLKQLGNTILKQNSFLTRRPGPKHGR